MASPFRMRGASWLAILGIVAVSASACRKEPIEALKLEGNLLTVNNRTKQPWKNVNVWLNHHYRIQTKSLEPNGVLNAPLNMFVAGFGQKFDWRSQQITDLRLTAELPDGSPLEIKKQFERGGLAGAVGDAVKKR